MKIFVFGSNLAGRHGKGAALVAHQKYGAVRGQGKGLQGQSYAIPTKAGNLEILTIDEIRSHISCFVKFAEEHKELEFYLTPIGTGLAGYKDKEIAKLFNEQPENCFFPSRWKDYLPKETNFYEGEIKLDSNA